MAEAADAEILVVSYFAREEGLALLGHAPRLRLVQALTAGTDDWIDKIPRGVTLANASSAAGATTAELILATLLAVLRELPQSVLDRAQAHWRPRVTESLSGKRALVLGAGAVGSNVVTCLRVMPPSLRRARYPRRATDPRRRAGLGRRADGASPL